MYTMITTLPAVIFIASLILHTSALKLFEPKPLPDVKYQHEIIYPRYEGQYHQGSKGISEILRFSVNPRIPSKIPFLPNIDFYDAGNLYERPAYHSVNLFTPNTVQQPAATPGQRENYRKALEEEAREAENESNAVTTDRQFTQRLTNFDFQKPRSYVSVQLTRGGKSYDYRYTM